MHHLLRALCCGEVDHRPNCYLATFLLTKNGPLTSRKSQNQGFPEGRGWKSLRPIHQSLGWPQLKCGGKRLPMDHGTLTRSWFLIYGPINPRGIGGRMQSWQKSCSILPWCNQMPCWPLIKSSVLIGDKHQWTLRKLQSSTCCWLKWQAVHLLEPACIAPVQINISIRDSMPMCWQKMTGNSRWSPKKLHIWSFTGPTLLWGVIFYPSMHILLAMD